MNGDITAIADQHVDVALDRKHMDLAIVRIGIDGDARSLGTGGRNQFRLRGGLGGRCILQLGVEPGHIVSGPPSAASSGT